MQQEAKRFTRGRRLAILFLVLCCSAPRVAQSVSQSGDLAEEAPPTMRATGSFEVSLKPLEPYNQAEAAKVGRLSIDKSFDGDLVATSKGEMLTGGSPAEGSAGYVAIERVTGRLADRRGSFLLQHSGTMTPAGQELTVTVIPGSGTEELRGLVGAMTIQIEDGKHSYEFEYSLSAAQ